MPSFSNWYSQQYAAWNRTRRLRATPYLARTDTNTSRRATALATGLATANAQLSTNDVEANLTDHQRDKREETLFGPNVGIVSDGPSWAQSDDAKKGTSSDYLTPEIVRRWVEASKEAVQPTTTLQALVNLKRPTLRLSPLTMHLSDDPSDDPSNAELHSNHALEFEYDCDAPKCSIAVQVIVPSKESNSSGDSGPLSQRITVYESVFEGGFSRLLKLEDGAIIELGRFEHMPHGAPVVDVDHPPPKIDKGLMTTEISEHPDPSSQRNPTPSPTPDNQENARKRRFAALHFRRRSQNRSVSGPALAVLDNDTAAVTEVGEKDKEMPNDDGVRVVIQLVALDDFGKELPSVNRQSTYLHVVRLGSPGTGGEDNKPWVVKVVKREATIGPHTFHLHEIYGLSSASTQTTVPVDNEAVHTYPPTVPAPAEDEPSSECLVCLSSPREVVLLPCRHLVACKECAINMVEFGAGGAIMHAEEPTTTTEPQPTEVTETTAIEDPVPPVAADENAPAPSAAPEGEASNTEPPTAETSQTTAQPEGDSETTAPSPSAPAPAPSATPVPSAPTDSPVMPPAPQNPRRKRRAKGWSCPVCRQPYTSLLRITTTPPTMEGGKEGKRVSTSTIDHPLVTATHATPASGLVVPTPALESTPEEPTVLTPTRSLRPVFLRGLSRRAADPAPPV